MVPTQRTTANPDTVAEQQRRERWWNRLSTVAKKAIIRGGERRRDRAFAKAALRADPGVSGYCCPKCHVWHATPEARKACRNQHLLDAAEAKIRKGA